MQAARTSRAFAGPIIAAGLTILAAATGAEPAGVWRPTRLAAPPRIDGVLDDTAWQAIPPLVAFSQVEPVAGAAPSERTEVRLGWDEKNLYFAAVAHDAEPAGIVATQRKRDVDLGDDDHIVLVLDPFLDRRNGYLFAFNALGARRDALVENGFELNANWDGIWEVKSRRTPTGWIAEGAIPLSTMSFNPLAAGWGFNVERRIARRSERMRWRAPSLQYEVSMLPEAGLLAGLTGLRRGLGLELRPYASLTYVDDRRTGLASTRLKPGFDLFYKITDSTTAVLTVNTDFADAEVDERQVNLTRFALSFPEKRAFFLQDAGIFSFSLINSSPLPYNSRRIGIGPNGEQIDLLGGVRISGREGRVNFGTLAVRLDRSGGLDAKDLGVARVSVNIFEGSSAGLIATRGDPGTNGRAWLVGSDFTYRSSRLFGRASAPFQGSVWAQHTDADGRKEHNGAFGYEFLYDSRTWGLSSFFEKMGRNYYPALGFVRQTGIWQGNVKLDREFNPAGFKRVVPAFVLNRRYSDLYHGDEYSSAGPDLTVDTTRGDLFLLRFRAERERLPAAFRVANGVVVRPGRFDGTWIEASATFSKSRPLAFGVDVARKPYYGGTQTFIKNTLTWRPSPMFNFDGAFDYTAVELPYARFPVRLVKLGAAVQFSPDLVWSALCQYDNLTRSIGANTRVRWTFAPGSDVFFVVNQGIDTSADRWTSTRTELGTKAGATWRF